MKWFVLYISIFSLLFSCPNEDENGEWLFNSDHITIRENFFNDSIIGFYLSSIDLESGESTTLLFDHSIDFSGAISDSNCGDINEHAINEIYLEFDIKMYMPSFRENENINLSNGRVHLYDIPSNLSEISFRNTDLNKNTTELSGGTKFAEFDSEVNLTDGEIEEISDLFLSQGRAPNGVYTFNFRVLDKNDQEYASISRTVEVFVPSFLDLITPGSPEISDSLSNVTMMTNPIFQWNSDFCNKCDFFIKVSEFRANDHTSLEEALEDYSVLPLDGDYYELPPSTNSFQYPNADVGELYPGKMYVWQIKRSYSTSNGINDEFSPIYLFKIQSLDITSEEGDDLNLENLKLLIGPDVYNSLFNEEGILNGYNQLNSSLSINNQTLSINYLMDLINKKNEGQITIIDVNVE